MREPNVWFLEHQPEYATYVWNKNVFSDQEIDRIVSWENSLNISEAYVGTGDDKRLDTNERKTKIGWIVPGQENDWLYRKLVDAINYVNFKHYQFDLTYIENLQYTVYTPGLFYNCHQDLSINLLGARKLTFTIQLTNENEYEGGDVRLHCGGPPVPIPREKGTMTFFPSYNLHDVTRVTSGIRRSLVGWVCGPKFK